MSFKINDFVKISNSILTILVTLMPIAFILEVQKSDFLSSQSPSISLSTFLMHGNGKQILINCFLNTLFLYRSRIIFLFSQVLLFPVDPQIENSSPSVHLVQLNCELLRQCVWERGKGKIIAPNKWSLCISNCMWRSRGEKFIESKIIFLSLFCLFLFFQSHFSGNWAWNSCHRFSLFLVLFLLLRRIFFLWVDEEHPLK